MSETLQHQTFHRNGIILVLASIAVCAGNPALAQDMPLSQVLMDDEPWRLVSEGFDFTEGPAVDDSGRLYFADVRSSTIYRLADDGKVEEYITDSGGTSGLCFGPDGRLFACQHKSRQVVAYEPDGSFAVLASLPSCNDLIVDHRGNVFVTDPKSSAVWLMKPGSKAEPKKVAKGFRPNGVILWQDDATLVVTDSDAAVLHTFRIEPNGGLKFGARYYSPLQVKFGSKTPRSDGMTVDDDGRLYVATDVGVQMFDSTGRLGGTISKPQNAFLSNIVFGGSDFQTLYATSADKVFARRVKPSGTPSIARYRKPK